jgi:hypothetical protein
MSGIQQNKNKWRALPYVLGGFSFMPLCGVPFGIITILWGLLSWKRGGKILVLLGTLGISLTIAIYGSLFYFGFIQRGGIYDSLRVRLAESSLINLVKSIEFYKLQNGIYPVSLDELAKSQKKSDEPIFIMDPTIVGPRVQGREFYYEVTKDGSSYYLLGVGIDGIPFTSDDILPKIDNKNTGLLFNPDSQPNP